MNTMIRKFLAEEDGVTALEYGVLAAIAAAAITATFGTELAQLFTSLFGALAKAVGVTAPTASS
jgi:pilus assembly protein Flp/PilA